MFWLAHATVRRFTKSETLRFIRCTNKMGLPKLDGGYSTLIILITSKCYRLLMFTSLWDVRGNCEQNVMCCVPQWSCTVTQRSRLWRGFCSAPRTTTWRMATTFSSRTGRSVTRPPNNRLLSTPATLTMRLIYRDVGKLSTSSNRCLPLTVISRETT